MTCVAHISIHDVAPETLGLVERMLVFLKENGASQVMLLVIPGLPWSEEDVDQLRKWVDAGHLLAGHGRTHHVASAESLYHKVHSALISRDVAEHLSKTEDEIAELMLENYQWFGEHGLPCPSHYVPPAWALGRISFSRLQELPFRTVEVLRGVLQVDSGRLYRMPLLGYEADTPVRAVFLRGFNRWNASVAHITGRAARISLHPYDLDYRLNHHIPNDLARFALKADMASLLPQ